MLSSVSSQSSPQIWTMVWIPSKRLPAKPKHSITPPSLSRISVHWREFRGGEWRSALVACRTDLFLPQDTWQWEFLLWYLSENCDTSGKHDLASASEVKEGGLLLSHSPLCRAWCEEKGFASCKCPLPWCGNVCHCLWWWDNQKKMEPHQVLCIHLWTQGTIRVADTRNNGWLPSPAKICDPCLQNKLSPRVLLLLNNIWMCTNLVGPVCMYVRWAALCTEMQSILHKKSPSAKEKHCC